MDGHKYPDVIPPSWCFLHYTASPFKHVPVAAVPAFWCVPQILSAGPCWQVHPRSVTWYGPVTSPNCSWDILCCHAHGTLPATANKQLPSSDPVHPPLTRPNAYLPCVWGNTNMVHLVKAGLPCSIRSGPVLCLKGADKLIGKTDVVIQNIWHRLGIYQTTKH